MRLHFLSIEARSDKLRLIVVGYRDGRGGRRDRTLWSAAKLRKPTTCARCQCELAKGAEAYLPITNGLYRAARLCTACAGPS